MNYSAKNRMGAGDGIAIQENRARKRVPVPSSRKFATRGVTSDPRVKQKLRVALEEFVTPPESPLRRRSLSIPELTPVTRSNSSDLFKPNAVATPTSKRLSLSKSASEKRVMNAGRRVCHQLVLNAWRRRRSDLAAAVDSKNRLQEQLSQLQIQIDVVQKLREAEAARRHEAVNETHQHKLIIEDLLAKNRQLKRLLKDMEKEQDNFKIIMDKLHVEVMNERNANKTINLQKAIAEDALVQEKMLTVDLQNEVKVITNRIEDYERNTFDHKYICEQYDNALKMAEDKYGQLLLKNEQLAEEVRVAKKLNEQLHAEHREVSTLVNSLRSKNEKIELKLHDLKKSLGTCRQQKKMIQDENEALQAKVTSLQNDIQYESERQWWLKTSEFLYQKFTICAQLLFPAMPARPATIRTFKQLPVIQGSIGFGSL